MINSAARFCFRSISQNSAVRVPSVSRQQTCCSWQIKSFFSVADASAAPSSSDVVAKSLKPSQLRPARKLLPPPISLTTKAADRINEILAGRENVLGIRLGVKRRGCNGYSYVLDYAEVKDEEELKKFERVESHGVLVYVDPKAVFFVVGTEMDWLENELTAEFTFTNPNSKGSCGCGESFNV